MSKVCEFFSEVFAYIRQFEQQNLHAGFQPSYEEVREAVTLLLEQQDSAAKQHGISDQVYQDARFAVVTWADETILRCTTWQHHSKWHAFPLQLEYYHTRNAGEEVLTRLERFPADQKEIRELYYQCFDLKLIGRYFLSMDESQTDAAARATPEQPSTISLLMRGGQEEACAFGPEAARSAHARATGTAARHTPPDQTPSPEKPARSSRWFKLRRIGMVGLLLGGVGLGALVALFWPYPELFRQPAGEAVLPVPLVSPPTNLHEAVTDWLATRQELLACSRVSWAVTDTPGGTVHLQGRIASEAQRTALYQGLGSIAGVNQVSDTLEFVPAPGCEVLALLEPFGAGTPPAALVTSLNKAGERPVYYAKEHLVIEVRVAAAASPQYVYVDYYTADHAVWHVFPNPQQPQHLTPSGGVLSVGDVNGPAPWSIAPPFGVEFVTVMSSPVPLFAQPRYGIESAATFLPVLRQALATQEAAAVRSTFHVVQTMERP